MHSPLFGVIRKEHSSSIDISSPSERCNAEIKRIRITYGDIVDSIQTTYKLSSGQEYTAPKMGTDSIPILKTIDLNDGDSVVGVFGQVDDSWQWSTIPVINQLTFVISSNQGVIRTYGPYGTVNTDRGSEFSIAGPIRSFYGRYDQYMRAFGAFVKNGGYFRGQSKLSAGGTQ